MEMVKGDSEAEVQERSKLCGEGSVGNVGSKMTWKLLAKLRGVTIELRVETGR